MRHIIISILLLSLCGCKTMGYHWLKNAETGELELVEIIQTEGTGKHDVEFKTGGKAKSDSGWKVPQVNVPKLEFE